MKKYDLLVITTRFLVALSAVVHTLPCAVAATAPNMPAFTNCPRYGVGSVVNEPQDLFSSHGILRVNLTYKTRLDDDGNTLYCFMTDDGAQSPTLHLRPGDELMLTLKNDLPASLATSSSKHPMARMGAMPGLTISAQNSSQNRANCGGMIMTETSVNLHYHGTNAPPVCHQDEIIKTMINPGETFQYDVHFPADEPPGLYWYHPHIHGISEPAVQGGASGAIVIEGIENLNPEVASMPVRTLIVRDNLIPAAIPQASDAPAWDLSLNYIPIAYPRYTTAVLPMKPLRKQFWRVLNASADTILKLQLQYDGVPQELRIIGIDGVPTGSDDDGTEGKTLVRDNFLLAPAARVEFVVTAPAKSVKLAQLVTLNVDTGPDGDNDPQRSLATIQTSDSAPDPSLKMAKVSGPPPIPLRFSGLAKWQPVRQRRLYFSEVLSDTTDPNSPTNFYITVDGATPTLFDADNPPAIVTTQGSVEDWIIENRALENHEFHIHQIHFLVMERDGKAVAGQYRDTVNVPYWRGSGPYPTVKLRMDFRGPDIGDFVYHCHILGHEDSGMMAIIRVVPR